MAKIICEECESSFKLEVVKGMKCCPVCGADIEFGVDDSHNEPSFGDDVILGEDDSFDEDKIDFWWYSIREPGEVSNGITYTRGNVFTTCAKCNHLSCAPYYIAKSGDYLLIDSRYVGRCAGCGNTMKNHILSKRPSDWVDPRQRDMWVKDYNNIPKCPICSSTKIHKISMTNKAASTIAFGIFAAGHVSKTYKCDNCGSKW